MEPVRLPRRELRRAGDAVVPRAAATTRSPGPDAWVVIDNGSRARRGRLEARRSGSRRPSRCSRTRSRPGTCRRARRSRRCRASRRSRRRSPASTCSRRTSSTSRRRGRRSRPTRRSRSAIGNAVTSVVLGKADAAAGARRRRAAGRTPSSRPADGGWRSAAAARRRTPSTSPGGRSRRPRSLLIALFGLVPIVWSFVLSFQKSNLLAPERAVRRASTTTTACADDPLFHDSVTHTRRLHGACSCRSRWSARC